MDHLDTTNYRNCQIYVEDRNRSIDYFHDAASMIMHLYTNCKNETVLKMFVYREPVVRKQTANIQNMEHRKGCFMPQRFLLYFFYDC